MKFYSTCGEYLTKIKEHASKKLKESDFWMIVITNLLKENITYQNSKINYRLARNTRDYQMAENVKWLVENKYSDQKIIVWAASGHVAKYADSSNKEKTMVAMGSYFTKDSSLFKSTYIIGFTSYEGEAGRLGSKIYSVNKPKSDGFENWIDEKYDYAFVDFKNYRKLFPGQHEKFFLKGLSHISFKTEWIRLFDGIFYVKKMYACER